MRRFNLATLITFAFLLASCGQKGPLYLAEKPPASDAAQPATSQNSADPANEQTKEPTKKPAAE